MPRFLHTADWQIGRLYSQFAPDDAVPLAAARLAAVETIARLATAHRVDAVLVAGDVFDAQTVAERTLRQLFDALGGYAGPWVMIPGNHDAALAESVWTRAARLGLAPPNLRLALQQCVLEAGDLAVLAAPLTQRHTHDDLTAWFDTAETPPGALRIGLAHGSVQGVLADDIDSPNPIAADRAARARLDYLALGDWHGMKRVDARTWYSGTPETDRHRGNEPGHALLVEIDAPGAEPRVTPLATGRYRWQRWQHALAVASDADRLLERLAALGADDVIELALAGEVDLASLQRIDAALAGTAARVRSLRCERGSLRLVPTDDDIAALQADGYLGDVIVALRERQHGAADEAEVAGHALALLAGLLAERRGAA